jgi:hypothetical protein
MLSRALFFAFVLALLPAAGLAQEQAFTNRATELRERGAADARAIANLDENTAVKVLERGGGWTRVDAGGRQGWVRVFHLRFPVAAQAGESGGGSLGSLTSALGIGRERSRGASIATTGIRGLSTEELKNANPDNEALRRLQSYRADRGSAERFAREGRLAEHSVDYEGRR